MDPSVADNFECKVRDCFFVFANLSSTRGETFCDLPSGCEEAVKDNGAEAVECCGEFYLPYFGVVQTTE